MTISQAEIRARHFGEATPGGGAWGGHGPTDAFDFYCVAHDMDYSPKYLEGEVCHDGGGDGYCHDNCRRCPVPCPIDPCPLDGEEPD